MNHRIRFILSVLGCLVLGTFLLLVVLIAVERAFPKPPKQAMRGPAGRRPPGQSRPSRPWWQRAFPRVYRRPRSQARRQQRRSDGVQAYGGRGPRQTTVDRAHTAFREAALSTLYHDYYYLGRTTGLRARAAQAKGKGDWREYELDRLETRRLGMRFDETRDRSLLEAYRTSAKQTLNTRYTNFEDYFWAGHAFLFSGRHEEAAAFMAEADQRWPVHDTFYGYIYLYRICLSAIAGNSNEMHTRLKRLKEFFADWLYVETYLTDLEELVEIYPDAPLLVLLQGRIYEMVLNDADARRKYRRALERGLDATAASRARQALERLEERRNSL